MSACKHPYSSVLTPATSCRKFKIHSTHTDSPRAQTTCNLVRIVMIRLGQLRVANCVTNRFLTYLFYIFPCSYCCVSSVFSIQGGSLLNSSVSCGSRNQVRSQLSFMDWWQGWKLNDWRIQRRGLIGKKHYYSNRLKGSTRPPCMQSLFDLIFWLERRNKTYVTQEKARIARYY